MTSATGGQEEGVRFHGAIHVDEQDPFALLLTTETGASGRESVEVARSGTPARDGHNRTEREKPLG